MEKILLSLLFVVVFLAGCGERQRWRGPTLAELGVATANIEKNAPEMVYCFGREPEVVRADLNDTIRMCIDDALQNRYNEPPAKSVQEWKVRVSKCVMLTHYGANKDWYSHDGLRLYQRKKCDELVAEVEMYKEQERQKLGAKK